MQIIYALLRTLRNAIVAFFSHDLAMERRAEGLSVVLHPRQPSTGAVFGFGLNAGASSAAERLNKAQQELAQILSDLDALLEQQRGSHQSFRHIVYLRRTLQESGLQALHKIPLDVLENALQQLEAMVSNWSPAGLANLRSKMAVAVIDREHLNPEAYGERNRKAAELDNLPMTPQLPDVQLDADPASLAAAYAELAGEPFAQVLSLQTDGDRDAQKPTIKPQRAMADQLI